MNKTEREAAIQDKGLTAYRDAAEEHLAAINRWHDATVVVNETPIFHPLYATALYQYDEAIRDCANTLAIVVLEESKLGKE